MILMMSYMGLYVIPCMSTMRTYIHPKRKKEKRQWEYVVTCCMIITYNFFTLTVEPKSINRVVTTFKFVRLYYWGLQLRPHRFMILFHCVFNQHSKPPIIILCLLVKLELCSINLTACLEFNITLFRCVHKCDILFSLYEFPRFSYYGRYWHCCCSSSYSYY